MKQLLPQAYLKEFLIRSVVPINLPALFNSSLSLIGLYIANNFCIAILDGLCISNSANTQETIENPVVLYVYARNVDFLCAPLFQ